MKLYFIRHAQSAPSKNIPDADWPLSELGVEQSFELPNKLSNIEIHKIFSSPYLRAVKTVEPLSKKLNLEITTDIGFRERKLSNGMIDNWLEELNKTWQDFDYKLPEGESSGECQARVFSAMTGIVKNSKGTSLHETSIEQNIVISSHGNAIALFLNKIEPTFGFSEWKQMQNPHIYVVDFMDGKFRLVDELTL